MSRLPTAALAGGVFVVLFGTTWIIAPKLQGLSSQTAAAEAPMPKRSNDPRVEATFAKVRKQARATKPYTAEERAAENLEDDRSLAIVSRVTGARLPSDLVESARRDGPSSRNYVRYAQIEVADGRTIACVSLLGEERGRVEHMVTRYSATEVDEDRPNLPALADYIASGCAEAMRDHSSQLTIVQFYQKQASLLPKTPKYDAQRREIEQGLRNFRRGP